MENERLRLLYGDASSSSSGSSSSRGGGSPSISGQSANFSPSSSPQPLPPPPGLSLPNTFSRPGSVYQFPQNQGPGFPAFYPLSPAAPNIYGPAFAGNFQNGMVPGSGPPRYGFYNGQPQFVPQMPHQNLNTYRGNEYDLDKTLNQLLSNSHHKPSTSVGVDSYAPNQQNIETVSTNAVIKPIIENIVGSISMSNGTYTHFAPSFATASGSQSGHRQMVNPNYEVDPTVANNQSGYSQNHQQMFEMNNDTTITGLGHFNHPVQSGNQGIGNGKESPVNNSSTAGVQRSTTPKDGLDSGSRPQTPGKPSYLEVLTKSGPKSGSGSATVFRKAASASTSTSPSPVPNSSFNGDYLHQQVNAQSTHRKSGDFLITSSTSSAASSSCPSASSSPVTRPKLMSSNSSVSFHHNLSKGKENLSSSPINSSGQNSKPSTSKNTPTTTPTHISSQHSHSTSGSSSSHGQKPKFSSVLPTAGTNAEEHQQQRKVLSSQNHVSSGKVGKLGKKFSQTQNQFEFDIEDLDEESDNSSNWGWKTAGSKGKQNHNNNNYNIQSSNGKKVGNGNCVGQSGNGFAGGSNLSVSVSTNNNNTSSTERKTQTSANSISGISSTSVSSSGPSSSSNNNSGGVTSQQRKVKEKEKPRNRKEDRNCVVRRIEQLLKLWLGHLISALTWLWSLVVDVTTLSFSLGFTLLQDLYSWWRIKAVPIGRLKCSQLKEQIYVMWQKIKWKRLGANEKKAEDGFTAGSEGRNDHDDLLSLMGPDRNIMLPTNGDEALKRLLSVKGQDPYSILGIKSDSSDETVRRYYKKQAVLVHPDKNLVPGAEEAFKILARAFELVGDPIKRVEYHRKLIEAQAKEKVFGEIGNLLDQLRKKMEAATSTIRCTKCNSRHKKNRTDRPLFAARYCAQCRINHAAREGDLWAERKGLFGWAWHYFACMDCHIWEINEWAKCQKKNLRHLKADSHSVMYRLVAGAGNGNHNSQGNGPGGIGGDDEDNCGGDPEADDWDSLISNLCKGPNCSTSRAGSIHQHTGKGNGTCCGGSNGNGSSFNPTVGRKRKGKRK